MKQQWLFCTCGHKGCWCFLLVKLPFPGTMANRMGNAGPCFRCFEGDHMAGDPPWYYPSLIESQKEFIVAEGIWSE